MTLKRMHPFWRCRKGIAAVEFALVMSVVTFLLIGVTDMTTVMYYKLRLEEAANAGAQYAMTQGLNVNNSYVKDVVQSATTLKDEISVKAYNDPAATSYDGKHCHCYPEQYTEATGILATSTHIATDTTSACPTSPSCGSGSQLGRYMVIQVTYTYTPILPLTSSFFTIPEIKETTVVRIN